MEKLQLRIAKERKIEIQSLKGDEFQILKDYKKLEERKALLNNVHDFFDAKYDQQPSATGLAGASERAGGKSSLMSVDSAREQ